MTHIQNHSKQELDQSQLFIAGILFILFIVSLFLNLGIAPLQLEEPRRAVVALEMDITGNYIVPKISGEYYYNKPPGYNWILLIAYKLFGNYSEFATRFFSACSFLLMSIMLWWTGTKYVSRRFGIYSALLFLTTLDLLGYFSLTGEIDLFYSMITFGSFLALFTFYHSKQYYLMFALVYGLNAYGILTKGLPSIIFLGSCIVIFLLYNRDMKRLFSVPHLVGIMIFGVIVGGYFTLYGQNTELAPFIKRLWSESANRTVIQDGYRQVVVLLKHIVTFPLQIAVATLPPSMLLIFLVRKNFLTTVRSNRLIAFSAIMLLLNLLPYWISPGAKIRYIYMLFPFVIMLLTYFYLEYADKEPIRLRVFHVLAGFIILLVLIASIAMPWAKPLNTLPNIWLLSGIFTTLGAVVFGVYLRYAKYRFFMLLLSMIVVRFALNYTLLPIRADSTHSRDQQKKEISYAIADTTKGSPLYLLGKSRLGFAMIFYIQRKRYEILKHKKKISEPGYYIMEYAMQTISPYQLIRKFQDEGRTFVLVKKRDRDPAAQGSR